MVDWERTFSLGTPPLEIVARGTIMYLALYLLLRIILKRESGTTGVSDLLVIVLLADAAQNGMADDYTSVTDGILLVAVIIGWSYLLDAIAYHWPAAARLIRPRSLLLVRDGQLLRRNMRRELITTAELYEQLRQRGVDDIRKVREMRMESDGQFSLITRADRTGQRQPRRRRSY